MGLCGKHKIHNIRGGTKGFQTCILLTHQNIISTVLTSYDHNSPLQKYWNSKVNSFVFAVH